MPGQRSAQSACVVDHIALSQFVWDNYEDYQQVHLRDPNKERPCYHPKKTVLSIEPNITNQSINPILGPSNNFESQFSPQII
jgi:hypothetical protein